MSFKDIKGHERAIESLKKDIKNKHLAFSYLFCGAEGMGKFLVAKTFASALNCLNNVQDDVRHRMSDNSFFDSCDSCISCLKIQNNQHPDVHIIDNGYTSEIKIEEIRKFQQDLSLSPYEARLRVFLINDADNLNPVSANAFLKTLEEPTKNSLIILVSDKPQLLPKTIISRCRIVKFFPLARIELARILKDDCKIDEDTVHYLAYFCEGRLGASLRLKDKDILRQKNRIINAFLYENSLLQDRDKLRSGLMVLAAWFRDIYLIKSGIPHTELINLDRRDSLLELMNHYSFSELDEILNCISDSLLYLEQNVNVKLLLPNINTFLQTAN